MSLEEFVSNLWMLSDKLEKDFDLIAIISYGTHPDRLTTGSSASFDLGLKRFDELGLKPVLAYCTFAHSFDGTGDRENELKIEKIKQLGPLPQNTKIIYCGPASSTISEAELVRHHQQAGGLMSVTAPRAVNPH